MLVFFGIESKLRHDLSRKNDSAFAKSILDVLRNLKVTCALKRE